MTKDPQIQKVVDLFITAGNTEIIEELYSSGYKAHAGEKVYSGHKFLKQYSKQIRTAIPDLQVVHHLVLFEDKKFVTWVRKLEGTHKANLMGIPASHKKVRWNEMVVSRFEDDKIAEEWLVSELAGELLLKQSK